MKKTLITTAIAGVLGTASFSANALTTGDVLSITAGGSEVTSCIAGTLVAGNCTIGGVINTGLNVTAQTGSFFNLGGSDTNLVGENGIIIGEIQTATGGHVGGTTGLEIGNIDKAWDFASNTGMHLTTSAITELSPGVLDMAGWAVNWGTEAAIPMGGCSLLPGGCDLDGDGVDDLVNTGTASIVITGSSYVLDYFANVPVGAPFGGAGYTLHLEGTVSPIPVPAAVWLFGSGLLGLVGVARRRKSA